MNCFKHQETTAIGFCKACSKGLCLACANDLGHGLACKDKHEQRVKDLEMVISKSITAYSDARKNIYIVPAFYFFMGLVFTGYSYYQSRTLTEAPFIMGLGFIAFGIVLLVRNRKIFSKKS